MRSLCAALCATAGLMALAACDPTYQTPPPPPATAYEPPAEAACIYTSRSYASGTRINPREMPGTTLQCVNGHWHSI
jgi:hypothetical protein